MNIVDNTKYYDVGENVLYNKVAHKILRFKTNIVYIIEDRHGVTSEVKQDDIILNEPYHDEYCVIDIPLNDSGEYPITFLNDDCSGYISPKALEWMNDHEA